MVGHAGQAHSSGTEATPTANGMANGTANGTANGMANGTANGMANGMANGAANGMAPLPPAAGARVEVQREETEHRLAKLERGGVLPEDL